MTPQQQQIAIAEACAWRLAPTSDLGGWKLYCGEITLSFWFDPTKTPTLADIAHKLPRFLNDLNAMHDAEERLSDEQCQQYIDHLADVTKGKFDFGQGVNICHWRLYHATAAHRAEAFLRTLGKWKDEA